MPAFRISIKDISIFQRKVWFRVISTLVIAKRPGNRIQETGTGAIQPARPGCQVADNCSTEKHAFYFSWFSLHAPSPA
jgi:hypothetical protein